MMSVNPLVIVHQIAANLRSNHTNVVTINRGCVLNLKTGGGIQEVKRVSRRDVSKGVC